MSPTQKRLPQTGSLFSCPAGGQAIKEIQGNHLKVNFQAEVGLDIRCPAGGQAIKEIQGKSLESKLSGGSRIGYPMPCRWAGHQRNAGKIT